MRAGPRPWTTRSRAIRRRYGEPEALIYNAAIIEPARFVTPSAVPFVQYGNAPGWHSHGAPADFDYLVECFKTNVAGALHAARQVSPAMVARGQGTILLTGGVLAFDPWLEWGVTSLGKAALRSLGLSLHKELTPEGITRPCGCHPRHHGGGHALRSGAGGGGLLAACTAARCTWRPDFHFKPEG